MRHREFIIILRCTVLAAVLLWQVRDAGAQTPSVAQTGAGTRLITLGTGFGPYPVAHQAQSSNLLIVNGTFYLIDVGDGTLRRLGKAGIRFHEIGVIFITHPHSDHMAGLGPLMAAERNYGRKDPINVYGPYGIETIVAATIQYLTPDAEIRSDDGLRTSIQDMFQGHDVATGVVYQDANIKVTAAENSHFHLTRANPGHGRYKSYAYRFEMPDKVVVFTGDTGPSPSVEELAKNADILVSEVLIIDDFLAILRKNGTWDAMSAERQVGVVRHLGEDHLTPEEVGKLASRAQVKRVVLSHVILTGDDDVDSRHYVDRVKKFYSGPVDLAKDLKQF